MENQELLTEIFNSSLLSGCLAVCLVVLWRSNELLKNKLFEINNTLIDLNKNTSKIIQENTQYLANIKESSEKDRMLNEEYWRERISNQDSILKNIIETQNSITTSIIEIQKYLKLDIINKDLK